MQYKSKKDKKVFIIILIAALVAIGLGTYVVFGMQKDDAPSSSNNSVDYGPATEEQKVAGNEAKKNAIDRENPPANDESSADRSRTDVTITRLEQSTDRTLQASAIARAIDTNASCVLTATKGGSTVTKQVAVIAQSSFSSCADFSVPASELSAGEWTVTIAYNSDSFTGSSSQKITID